jgi:orotidine-5'-phosphate decarboxylase
LGLDPRIERIPSVIREQALVGSQTTDEAIRRAIAAYHEVAIAAVTGLVPAVKLQLAFYEQYGIGGLLALNDTIKTARLSGLLVIADGKRNDIASTAEAYARAYLGQTSAFGETFSAFEADALTVNPYLGWDSLVPFALTAAEHGKGLFVLAHTSNPSAPDLQEATTDNGDPIYLRSARLASRLSDEFFPAGSQPSVGMIVGCTFPTAAAAVRQAVPLAPIVVVGYGAQAGRLEGCVPCFTDRGDQALVNASRSLTYAVSDQAATIDEIGDAIRSATKQMGHTIRHAIA